MKNKFKKVVVLSLAVVITLSSNLNAFAWKSTAHHSTMVKSQSSAYFTKNKINYQKDTALAAKYTDTEKYMDAGSILPVIYKVNKTTKTAYIISPYHAKANLNCTTVQATSMASKANQGYSLADVKSTAGFLYKLAQAGINGQDVYKDKLKLSLYSSNVEKRIVVDLKNLIEKKFSKKAPPARQGYIIFGVYLHLVQDISAHRAAITYQMVNSGNIKAADFKSKAVRTKLLKDLKNKTIPMIRLKDYLKESKKKSYEDNSSYWSARYTSAKNVTLEEVKDIYNGKTFDLPAYGIAVK